jgi:hypothetical protein
MLLQHHVASMGLASSVAQKNNLLEWRRKLEAWITAYEQWISIIMKLDDDTTWSVEDGHIPDINSHCEEVSDNIPDFGSDGWFTLEVAQITLPSALGAGEIGHLSLPAIATIEAELRKGQVSDALQGLCLALGEKSLCVRTEVRNVNSQ